jgi:glycosyltransferase involved in cell wall biosynthesis
MTDIVLCTKNRLPLLMRTLDYLLQRTTAPFRLHAIDDASTEGNEAYLRGLLVAGRIASLVTREYSVPIGENWNAAARLASTDVLVFTDDDVLCPALDPDWLSRGLAAMDQHRQVGLLALHDPSAPIRAIRQEREITICDRVGAHLAFIRRDLMRRIVIPPVGGSLEGIDICADSRKLDRAWSRAVQSAGYEVGYLTDVYCQHIGLLSVRNGQDLSGRVVGPVDERMLHVLHAGGRECTLS